jgi:hypothetical protein
MHIRYTPKMTSTLTKLAAAPPDTQPINRHVGSSKAVAVMYVDTGCRYVHGAASPVAVIIRIRPAHATTPQQRAAKHLHHQSG